MYGLVARPDTALSRQARGGDRGTGDFWPEAGAADLYSPDALCILSDDERGLTLNILDPAIGRGGSAEVDASADIRVVPLPRIAQGGRWRTEAMRSYRQVVLYWFTRGQGRFTVAGAKRGYGAHNLLYLPAGTMHGFEMTGQVYGTAVFLPDDPALGLPPEPLHLRFRDAPVQAEITGLIDNMQREIDRDLPLASRALLHHAGLLAVWLDRQAAVTPDPDLHTGAARQLAAAYTALVEKDFATGKSVTHYAAELGVTPTHLSRSCNAACGRPASSILADRVHFEARRLLRETRTPVKDVATQLGFRSAAYFTRAFQKQTGQTPTAFRAGRTTPTRSG